jgi:hypothetical protein
MILAPYDVDDSFDLFRVFFPGEFFNAAIQIHGIRSDDPDGFLNIAVMEAARQNEGINGFDPAGQIPVGRLARPSIASRLTMVHQDRFDRILRQCPEVAIRLKSDGLDETLRGKSAAIIRRLIAVELDQVKAAKNSDFGYL